MSNKSELLEEDSRSFEEEGFYSFSRDEEFTGSASASSQHHQTWSPFDDLDDSGHFTASPDVEIALSGSSRSHSPCPCPSSAQLVLLQMQHLEGNSHSVVNSQQQQQQQCEATLQAQLSPQKNKPLISPRSVMTVKVPQSNIAPSMVPFSSSPEGTTKENNNESEHWQLPAYFRPDTYKLGSSHRTENGMGIGLGLSSLASSPAPSSSSISIRPPLLAATALMGSGGDASMNLHLEGTKDESCEYLRSILVNFNSLYMEKLRMIDDLVTEGNEEQKKLLMEKKTSMLENWAKDVCVHNMVLVHTVEELEREANRKVSALQKKMTESTQLAKEHMNMIKKYEEQVKLLLKDHSDTEERNLVLKIELEKLKSECRRVRDRMNMLLKDNESLLTLVCRIRDMGVWDVNGLELQRSSFDQIFGLYPNLAGGEVQTVFTREKARHFKDTETRVIELEEELHCLKKSQKEAETFVLQKDRKIEELEMEIKNVLNKAHYCEKECNDYKLSLLETQEKLLEATRRLAQSPRQVKQSDLRESEMSELLKELRDVKSQLNTAVEEKHSAKEESNYFRRELGDRLKEMHDIQNVFQNLATEVVTSRAAFQQVQEKEVQLQSLKSEVQTYQSRCSDAEDTIRRKEKEIQQLQKQMNDIHKRTEAVPLSVPVPASAPSICSYSKADSNLTTSGQQSSFQPNDRKNASIPYPKPILKSKQPKPRNVFTSTPSRIPVHVRSTVSSLQKFHSSVSSTTPTQIPAWNQNGERPPWNTHFKKSTGILSRPPPALLSVNKMTSSKPSRSQSSLIRSSLAKTEVGLESMENDCKDIYDRLTDLERQMSEKTSNNGSSNMGQDGNKFEKLMKLPKIASQHVKREQRHPPKPTAIENGMKGGKLPVVHDTRSYTPKPRSASRKPTKIPLKNNVLDPRAPTPRLNALITAVVETSKKLLEQSGTTKGKGTEEKPPRGRSYTITAAHYHRHKRPKEDPKSQDLRRTQSSEKNAEVNRRGGGDIYEDVTTSLKTAKKYHSSTDIGAKNDQDNDYDNSHENEAMEVIYESPPNVKEYLSKLPEDSCEEIVKGWIRKSSSHSLREDVKNQLKFTKSLPVRGRQSSVRVMKHLATRRAYPPRQSTTKSNRSSELTDELENEMFELEEEWGKVFANIEHKNNGATAENEVTSVTDTDSGDHVEKSSGPTDPRSIETSAQDNSKSASSHSETSSNVQFTTPHPNQNNPEQSPGTKCQENEALEALLNRLTTEKREMEERHRKELEDKNVELKMQKLTIQHLQDAYVALKRGQPIPVPQSVTGNKIIMANANGSSNGHHKTSNNNNNGQILDV